MVASSAPPPSAPRRGFLAPSPGIRRPASRSARRIFLRLSWAHTIAPPSFENVNFGFMRAYASLRRTAARLESAASRRAPRRLSTNGFAMLLRLIHRIIEIFLHLERRIEQPFLRPAFNAVFRAPAA